MEEEFDELFALRDYNERLKERNQELQAMIVKAKELLCLAMDNLNHGNVDWGMDNIDGAIDSLGGL